MKDWLKDKFYYRKKYNTANNTIDSLKVEIYDYQEKLKRQKAKNDSNKEIIEKVKKMPKEIKKEFDLC